MASDDERADRLASIGYLPKWLRLSEALDLLERDGRTLSEAKAFLTRMMHDELPEPGFGGIFRLPGWRPSPSPYFPGQSWATTPIVNWENSTIIAPQDFRNWRADRSTLIEVSRELLTRELTEIRAQAPSVVQPSTRTATLKSTQPRARPTAQTYAAHWTKVVDEEGTPPTREADRSWAQEHSYNIKYVLATLRKEHIAELPSDKKPKDGPRKGRTRAAN